MKTKKLFNFLRVVAIAALVCTLAVIAVMMIYSATPGEKSAQQSNQVAEDIKDVFNVEEEKVESARVQLSEVKGFVGETYTLATKYFPAETTDKEVVYTSADPTIAEVTEGDRLTFKKAGIVKVTVTKKSDSSVKHTASMTCYGTHPDKITSISPWEQNFLAGKTQNFYLKDQDGNKLLLTMFKPASYDEDMLYFTPMNILPFKEGKTTVTLSIPAGLGKKDYTAKTLDPVTVNISKNPNYVQPTDVVLVNDGVYDLKLGEELPLLSLLEKVLPQGASKANFSYSLVTNPGGVVKVLTNNTISAQKVGSIQVKIYTKYNPSLVEYATINVFDPPPTKLSVTGPKNARAQYDKTYTLKAYNPSSGNTVKDVTWSVVKGTGTIDPKTGKLSDLKFGKNITVRATYNNDENVFVDYNIKVVMYENFASSMRKLVGHFLLFALIGFGLVYTFVFMIKPRVLAVPLSIASGFGLAVVSEALQLPAVTTGRYAAWSDVFIDFFGSVMGIVFAFLLLGIILLAFKLSKSRKEFNRAFKAVSITTVFRPTSSAKVQKMLSSPQSEDGAPAEAYGSAPSEDIHAQNDDDKNRDVEGTLAAADKEGDTK